jgi:hypothetical protein
MGDLPKFCYIASAVQLLTKMAYIPTYTNVRWGYKPRDCEVHPLWISEQSLNISGLALLLCVNYSKINITGR